MTIGRTLGKRPLSACAIVATLHHIEARVQLGARTVRSIERRMQCLCVMIICDQPASSLQFREILNPLGQRKVKVEHVLCSGFAADASLCPDRRVHVETDGAARGKKSRTVGGGL
jgi:hypothetical protein